MVLAGQLDVFVRDGGQGAQAHLFAVVGGRDAVSHQGGQVGGVEGGDLLWGSFGVGGLGRVGGRGVGGWVQVEGVADGSYC